MVWKYFNCCALNGHSSHSNNVKNKNKKKNTWVPDQFQIKRQKGSEWYFRINPRYCSYHQTHTKGSWLEHRYKSNLRNGYMKEHMLAVESGEALWGGCLRDWSFVKRKQAREHWKWETVHLSGVISITQTEANSWWPCFWLFLLCMSTFHQHY